MTSPVHVDPDRRPAPAAVTERISSAGIIGIVRSANRERAMETAERLLDAGLDVVEISLVTPDALAVITALAENHPQAVIGAGTVLTRAEAHDCVLAGAKLLVSPIVDEQVIRYGAKAGVLAIPGANTPTECIAAVRLGSPLVKLFPASTWSPASVTDLLSSLPALRLVPTGGVRIADAAAWYAAGATALGIGHALASGTPSEASARMQELRQAVQRGH